MIQHAYGGTAPKFCMFHKRGLLLLHPVEHTILRSYASVTSPNFLRKSQSSNHSRTGLACLEPFLTVPDCLNGIESKYLLLRLSCHYWRISCAPLRKTMRFLSRINHCGWLWCEVMVICLERLAFGEDLPLTGSHNNHVGSGRASIILSRKAWYLLA